MKTAVPFRPGDLVRRVGSRDVGRVIEFIEEEGVRLVLVRWLVPGVEPNPSAEPSDHLVRIEDQ